MKPITSRVKESCSPLKQTTGKEEPKTPPKETITGTGVGADGQLQNYEVTGNPGSTEQTKFKPGSPAFDKAFGDAKKAGKKTFDFGGNLFNTEEWKPTLIQTPGNVNANVTDLKAEAVEGTKSDVADMWEIRKYGPGGRADKRLQRQERKEGRQSEKRLKKSKRKGVVVENYDEQMKAAKAMRYGQGPMAKEVRKQMLDPKQSQIQREQITQKKIEGKSTYTDNFAVPTKHQKGGGPVMAPPGTKSTASQVEDAKNTILNRNASNNSSNGNAGSGSVVSSKGGLFSASNYPKFEKAPFKMKGFGKKG